jgi:hypothetical protein
VGLMSLVGLVVSLILLALVPQQPSATSPETAEARGGDGRGFNLLLAIGAFDTATPMGYLLYLPFLIHPKGGGEATIGIGLTLLFAGGALGKACCGWLGQRFGIVWSVIVTEAATTLFIVATLVSPLGLTLVILPNSWDRPERHVFGPLWNCSRTGAEGRGRPGLRALLYGRPWCWGIGANRIWHDCGPFRSNPWNHRSGSDGGSHHPDGSCPTSLLARGTDRTGGTMIIKQEASKEAPSLVAVPEILLAGIRTNVQLTASSATVFRRGTNTS